MSKLFSISMFILVFAPGSAAIGAQGDPGIQAIKEATTALCQGGAECSACMAGEYEYVYSLASGGTEAIVGLTVVVDEADVVDAGSFDGPGSVAPTSIDFAPFGVTWNFANPLAAGDLSENLYLCSPLSPVDGVPFLNGADGSVSEIPCPVPGGDSGDPGDVCKPADGDGDKNKKKSKKSKKKKSKKNKKKSKDKKKSSKSKKK